MKDLKISCLSSWWTLFFLSSALFHVRLKYIWDLYLSFELCTYISGFTHDKLIFEYSLELISFKHFSCSYFIFSHFFYYFFCLRLTCLGGVDNCHHIHFGSLQLWRLSFVSFNMFLYIDCKYTNSVSIYKFCVYTFRNILELHLYILFANTQEGYFIIIFL